MNSIISMTIGAFFFALMAAMTRYLADDVSWPAIAFARSFLALLVAVAAAMFAGSKLAVLRPRSLWLRSLAGSASLLCNFFAMTHLPLADSVTLFYLYPLWIPFLSWALFKYAITAGDVLAVACGISGLALIAEPHFASTGPATVAALLSSLLTALAMVGLHNVRGVDTWAIVAHFSGVSSIAALVGWLVVPEPLPQAEWNMQSVIFLVAIGLAGAIAQFFMSKAYTKGHPTWVGVAGLLQVVFAAGLDMLIWKRAFGPYAIVGIALILAPSGWRLTRRSKFVREEERSACSEQASVAE